MKKLIIATIAVFALLANEACTSAQAIASGTYIAAEIATAQILAKNPRVLPLAKLIVSDWQSFQLGKLSAQDEATLLNSIVAATNKQLTPGQAALLDGAVQQILANQNTTAPTMLTGAAAAAVTTVVNGISRAIQVYETPAA